VIDQAAACRFDQVEHAVEVTRCPVVRIRNIEELCFRVELKEQPDPIGLLPLWRHTSEIALVVSVESDHELVISEPGRLELLRLVLWCVPASLQRRLRAAIGRVTDVPAASASAAHFDIVKSGRLKLVA
jgi:hypothetical protein